jgi:hypothetical protein
MINLYRLYNDPKELDLYNLYATPIKQICDEDLMEQYKEHDYQPVLHIIKKSPETAYYYALRVHDDRWLEAEPYIIKDPIYAAYYSANVMYKRWIEAEPTIKQDYWSWDEYSRRFGI